MEALTKINNILNDCQKIEDRFNTDLSEEEKKLLVEGGLLDDDKDKVLCEEPQDL